MHGGAHRGDLSRLAVHEAERDVDVVDHEVHDHGVVLDARHEGPEAPRLDEDGPLDDLSQLLNGPVEALHVPDVENPVGLARDAEQLLGLLEGRRHRLLDEHVRPRLEQVARRLEVAIGRHGDRREVDQARELPVARERGDAVRSGDAPCLGQIRVDDAHEIHAPELGEGKNMILPHVPRADDGAADARVGRWGHRMVSSIPAGPRRRTREMTPSLEASMNAMS